LLIAIFRFDDDWSLAVVPEDHNALQKITRRGAAPLPPRSTGLRISVPILILQLNVEVKAST
jgi:hypothetical protein